MNKKAFPLLFSVVLISLICGILLAGCGSSASKSTPTPSPSATASPIPSNLEWKTPEPTGSAKIVKDIVALEKESLAFDAGTYAQGKIPPGEYAFLSLGDTGHYYSEEDLSGAIIDNQNFTSFGYVTVQGVGNVTTRGCLVAVNALDRLGVTGAKDLYEKFNDMPGGYNQSGFYKIGVDIPEGTHTVTSMGQRGYYAVLSGPVGNRQIIQNDNFDGSAAVEMTAGQYLELNRATVN